MNDRWVAVLARWGNRLQRWRLRLDRWLQSSDSPRVLATACWSFPVYSQTFVYQELTQLMSSGVTLRFVYSKLEPRDHLPAQSAALWRRRLRLMLHERVGEEDVAWFERRMPDRVASLMQVLHEETGMPVDEIRQHRHYRQALSFARFAAAYEPDYLHSYFFYEGTFFCLVASYLLDIPRGTSAYADHLLDDYDLKLIPLQLRQASLLIATSCRIKKELLSLGPCPEPERILVKPNAVDAQRFSVPDRTFGAPPPHKLVAVGRIDPKKGLTFLVEALSILGDRGMQVELSLVGAADENDLEYAEALNTQIQTSGAGHLIHLLGRRTHEEVRAILAAADIWVASAIEGEDGDKDGIPTALLEAMGAGLPIVTTDAGSILEVIEDSVTGLIVPQRAPTDLADALERIILDPALAERLSRAASEKVRAEFDVSVCEARFHTKLTELLRAG